MCCKEGKISSKAKRSRPRSKPKAIQSSIRDSQNSSETLTAAALGIGPESTFSGHMEPERTSVDVADEPGDPSGERAQLAAPSLHFLAWCPTTEVIGVNDQSSNAPCQDGKTAAAQSGLVSSTHLRHCATSGMDDETFLGRDLTKLSMRNRTTSLDMEDGATFVQRHDFNDQLKDELEDQCPPKIAPQSGLLISHGFTIEDVLQCVEIVP